MSPFLQRLRDVCGATPDRVALADGKHTVTFSQLWCRASALAAALHTRGFSGGRIGLLAAAGEPWSVAFLGTLMSGGVAVPLSAVYPPAELGELLRAGRVELVITSSDLAPLARNAAGALPLLDVADLHVGASMSRAAEPAARGAESVALLIFTSGTTGRPKGALLTDRNLAAGALGLAEAWGFSAEDVLLHTLPLHHVHGIGVALLVAWLSGATTSFVSPFDPARVWERLGECTVLMGVPTQHKKLFDAYDAADAATQNRWRRHAEQLRLVTSGSAALPRGLGERWRELAGQYPLERYGMTEVGIVLSNPLEGPRLAATVGRPVNDASVRIVGPTGADVSPGDAGEIWVQGPTVFAGYDQNPAATEAVFTEGWFRTGDTAAWTDEGYVRILGRTSVDILKSGGYKISALEIEEALREHPGIAEVAVVGIPDETWGDRVVAAVVARESARERPTEAAVRAWAKDRLAAYKIPKNVVFVAALPRNPLGKVQKPALVRQLTGA